ncbi:MAG: class I SAM-dependent methyltransferase [Elusimicrobiales bacterium]
MRNWQKKYFDPKLYTPATPAAIAKAGGEAAFALKTLGAEKGWRILDVCCGPGRHSIEMARRGMRVTGLDFCKPYLGQARARAEKLGLDINFIRGDMRAMPFDGEFDATVNMFTSFGYFDQAGNMRALNSMAKALRPGGKLLIDVIDRDFVADSKSPRDWHLREDGVYELEERDFDARRDIIRTRMVYIRPGQKPVERQFTLRLYNARTLSALLVKAGFKPLSFRDRLDFSKGGRGPRLVALAVKGE